MTNKPEQLRSARWFAPDDFRSFGHRSRMLQMGYAAADFIGKPVIAHRQHWSDANQCHSHFKQRVEDVKCGVFQAGGFPLELPAISLSESLGKPTTMLYRNFLAMETEELLRSHPVDGAVLMGGCDKTTPGLTMGALSMGLTFIYLPAGPMLRGNWRGRCSARAATSYHSRPSAPTNLTLHQAIDINVPIGCGDAPVFRGDVIVGDAEGAVVLPAHLADALADEATEMTAFEDFVQERVMAGQSILGLYPPTEEAHKTAFDSWRKVHGR